LCSLAFHTASPFVVIVVVVVAVLVVVVVVSTSRTSSSRVVTTPSGLVGEFRCHMTLLYTTITDDLWLLTLGHIMSTHTTVVADDIFVRSVVSCWSEPWLETSIWGWFSSRVFPWVDTSPLIPLLLYLPVIILESDCHINQFPEILQFLLTAVASSCRDSFPS
jgi:hypothetical protein